MGNGGEPRPGAARDVVRQKRQRTAARRGAELEVLHPDTMTRLRSVAGDEAAVQPPMLRPLEGGVIRCGLQTGEARGQDLAAAGLPPPHGGLQTLDMPPNPPSRPRNPHPQPVWRHPDTPARPGRACKGLAIRRRLPPFALARPPLARTRPASRASAGRL